MGEAERIAKIREAFRQRKQTGYPRILPKWLYLDDDGQLRMHENIVKDVVRLFTLAKDPGISQYTIALLCNFSKGECDAILSNRAVLGEYVPTKVVNGKVVRDEAVPVRKIYPPIIDEALFQLVQQVRASREPPPVIPGNPNNKLTVLSGRLTCAHCGAAIRKYKKGQYDYLRCSASCGVPGRRFEVVLNWINDHHPGFIASSQNNLPLNFLKIPK